MSAPKIITSYWAKPIPDRQFDWSAHYEGDEPNDDGQMMVGYGNTKEEAIIDLARLFAERAEATEQRFYEKHRHLEALDQGRPPAEVLPPAAKTNLPCISSSRIVACEACGTEGRIYHGNGDKPWDYVEECPYCDGTGGEIITTQPIEMADLDSEGAQ
jgi:hypothetical protein